MLTEAAAAILQEQNEQLLNPLENLWSAIQMLGGPVIAHAHLDRADTLTKASWQHVNAPLETKWGLVDEIKKKRSPQDIFNSMKEVVDRLYATENIRTIGTFIDVDPVIGDKAMEAAQMLRDHYNGKIRFVFINQALHGVLEPEAQKWFLSGAKFCDIVGGLPGKDAPYRREHIQTVLAIAKSMGKMAHIHVDQLNTTEEKETEMLAIETINAGMEGRVAAVHCISLAAHKKNYRHYVYELMQEAKLMTISCPTAWLNSRRKEDMQVSHNAVTPIDELIRFGIITAFGPDNIRDIYMPFTTGSMKTELQVLLEATHHYDPDNLALMTTVNGLKVLGIENG